MAESFQLRMSRLLAEGIRRHGAETFPYECCGALLGRDSASNEKVSAPGESLVGTPREVLGLFPLVNRRDDSPRNRFAVTADDSHPDHPARPSDFDREHAWPWYSYVIVSVMSGKPADMASWRLSDDRQNYSPEAIEIRNSALA